MRGTGRKVDILIKDRYQSFWLYDENLTPLWHAQCNTGHYPCALDLTGDCRDEIVVWDENEIWIYTQSDSGKKPGKLYQPVRDYLMNDSNYRAYVSIPPDYPAKIKK